MILQQLSPVHAFQAWPLIKPWAQQLADRFPDDWPVDHIRHSIGNETLAVFLIWDENEKKDYGAVFAMIVPLASGRDSLQVHVAGKEHKKWNHLLPVLEDWAKERGGKLGRIFGPRAWADSLPGYKRQQVTLFTKELV